MSGPPPMPTNLRLLRGDSQKKRLPKNEPQPLMADLIPEPPPFLEGYAAEEWRRVVVELYRLRLVTLVDINPLAAYCQCYKIWREATELQTEIYKQGDLFKGMVLTNRNGDITKNPLMAVARTAAADMLRYASEFGLTPAARARIAAGPYGETRQASKFDGLVPS
jgi:P27 family predicted phage terminase small subunit